MPGPPPPTVISANQGGVVAIVHFDHTVDVWHIPPNAIITIQPQAGFGLPVQSSASVSLSTALTDINAALGQEGAQ